MEDNLIKPDVVLVTKNIMVPLALPAPKNKLFLAPSISRKKTKIVRAKKNRFIQKKTLNSDENTMKQSRKDMLRSKEYLAYNYDSLVNLERDSKENYELLYSKTFALSDTCFGDDTTEGKMRQNYLSQIFPMDSMPVTGNSEYAKTSSLMSASEDNNTLEADWDDILPERSAERKIELLEQKDELSILKADIGCEFRENSVTEFHQYISSEINEFSATIDGEENKQSNECEIKYSWQNLDSSIAKMNFSDKKNELTTLNANIPCEMRENSATELRGCVSNEISKYAASVDKDRVKQHKSNECEVKYSWQDLDNWIPPSAKKKIVECNEQSELSRSAERDCKITYSWQIIGTGAQTSYELIQGLLTNAEESEEKRSKEATNYPCSVKYSWQIIGTGTQVSFGEDSSRIDRNYWDGKILMSGKRFVESPKDDGHPNAERCKILYSEATQTLADKSQQTELSDCRVKYSWQNLTKAYLRTKQRF